MDAPEKIVIRFFDRRVFEIGQLHAVQIESQAKILDCAILAAGVHRLHHDEQAALMFRVERFLQFCQALPEFIDLLDCVGLRIAGRFGGIDFGETNFAPRPNDNNAILTMLRLARLLSYRSKCVHAMGGGLPPQLCPHGRS